MQPKPVLPILQLLTQQLPCQFDWTHSGLTLLLNALAVDYQQTFSNPTEFQIKYFYNEKCR